MTGSRADDRGRPKRIRGVHVLALPIAVISIGAGVATSVPALAADTTLMSCSESELRSAVEAGGTVRFGIDCPALTLTSTLKIPSGRGVVIDADGHNVTLDGDRSVRHFRVTGGSLTLIGLKIVDGTVDGFDGSAGVAGANGADGTQGAPGSGGTGGGCVTGSDNGLPGAAGAKGVTGRRGTGGSAGGSVRGGAMLIDSGTVILTDVELLSNRALGGDGAVGGKGGDGGDGGLGGEGGPGAVGSELCPKGGDGGRGGAGGSGGGGGAAVAAVAVARRWVVRFTTTATSRSPGACSGVTPRLAEPAQGVAWAVPAVMLDLAATVAQADRAQAGTRRARVAPGAQPVSAASAGRRVRAAKRAMVEEEPGRRSSTRRERR